METSNNLRNVLIGQRIKFLRDHKNLVHESELKTSQRVIRLRLLLDEYKPKNIVVDALNRLQNNMVLMMLMQYYHLIHWMIKYSQCTSRRSKSKKQRIGTCEKYQDKPELLPEDCG